MIETSLKLGGIYEGGALFSINMTYYILHLKVYEGHISIICAQNVQFWDLWEHE